MNDRDIAETGRLREAVQEILAALEDFVQYQGPDRAARDREHWQAVLGGAVPQQGAGLSEVLRILKNSVIPNGLRNGAPGFCGWVTTSPTTSATAAALSSTVAGSQRLWVQPFNHLEALALRWLAELLHLPEGMQGVFTSGGSVANLIALGAARQHAFEKIGHDPSQDGLPRDRKWRIYASREVHHAVHRSAGTLGLGRRCVTEVAVDAHQRLDLKALEKTLDTDRSQGILPICIVATSGTVNTGAIDSIEGAAALAREHGTWLHVDGAYGLFGMLDERVAPQFAGIEEADSVAVDPHKWLAAPVGCGATFVRDRARLGRTFTMEPAEYLEGSMETEEILSPFDDIGNAYHDFAVEQSSPSRGVAVWAILKEIGVEGIRQRVRRHNDYARHLAQRVREDGHLELLAEPTLSICCFRYRREELEESRLDDLNTEIARQLRAETDHVPSTTRVDGKLAIRPCYINPRTTLAEVNGLADQVRDIGDRLLARQS